ncbi:MAG: ATP-binding cassette domain-containing protein [Ectothiorhodospiraceae bacterium]|nr:ATP-binding cassette domain-containing protein [Ectothiorhodospiraceae bacterium]
MSALLSVRDVTVRFGGITAIDGARLEVEPGRLLGFIGPNGAGKTTMMRVITGVVRPSAGQVLFRGSDITRWSTVARIRHGLALAQQIVRPLRALTLLDNVALAVGHRRLTSPVAAMLRHDRRRERERAHTLLERVGLAEVAGQRPEALPLGYLKRLEVARALALEPALLLLDEPLAGLNQREARAMADLIAELPGPSLAVVLIEHNLGEVLRVCPTLYVQDGGRALAFGPTSEVMARADVRAAYLGVGR